MDRSDAARIDTWIERGLGVFSTESGSTSSGADSLAEASESARRLAFERILLIHVAARMVALAYPEPVAGSALAWALGLGGSLAATLAFLPRAAGWAPVAALITLATLLVTSFPQTSNHGFLEIWCVLLLLVSGRGAGGDRLALGAIRASFAIVLFYTGFQKAMHGTYFDAQFLSLEVSMKPEFAAVFGLLAPEPEIARLEALDPSIVGSGPFRSDAPLFLLASNAVYLFELIAPFLLLWKRTRVVAVVAVMVFTLAIQSGAREVFFGGLLVNGILLFWPRDLHTRALPLFAGYYALLVAFFWLAPGGWALK